MICIEIDSAGPFYRLDSLGISTEAALLQMEKEHRVTLKKLFFVSKLRNSRWVNMNRRWWTSKRGVRTNAAFLAR